MTGYCMECSRTLFEGDQFERTALGPLCTTCAGVGVAIVREHEDDAAALAHYQEVLGEALAGARRTSSASSVPPTAFLPREAPTGLNDAGFITRASAASSASTGFDLERDALGDSRR